MSTRNPLNKRSQEQRSGDLPGFTRKSAGSAKPARAAASSVRVVPASSKAKRAAAQNESLVGLSKEEKRVRRQQARLREDRIYAASNELIRDDPEYTRRRRIFWIAVGIGIVLTVADFAVMFANGTLNNPSAPASPVQLVLLAGAYVCIIGGFIYDMIRVRPLRNESRAKAEGMSERKLDELLARAAARARSESKKDK